MVNAIECLECIDELKECRDSIRRTGRITTASKFLTRFRYPGAWEGERLHEAREVAKEIVELVDKFPRSSMKGHILRKIDPLIDMVYRK